MTPLLPALLLLFQAKPDPAAALDSRAQAITTDGKSFAWSLADGSVRLASLAGGPSAELARTKGDPQTGLAFSGDGKELAVASARGSLRILSVPDGRLLAELPCAPAGPKSGQPACAVDWLAGGSRLLLTGARARLVDRQALKVVGEFDAGADEPLGARAVSIDGEHFALGDAAGHVRVHSARDGVVEHDRLSVPGPVHALAFDNPASRLAIGSGDCKVRVFPLAGNGTPLELSLCDEDLTGKLAIGSVAFASDGTSLVASSFPWWVARAWELEKGTVLWSHDCSGGDDAPTLAAFTGDPSVVFVGAQGTRVDRASGKVLSSLGKGRFQVQGNVCWTRERDSFRIFDAREGKLLAEVPLTTR